MAKTVKGILSKMRMSAAHLAIWVGLAEFLKPYYCYTALVTQSGTNKPAEIFILENGFLENDLSWTYKGAGEYILNSKSGVFKEGKTDIITGMNFNKQGVFYGVRQSDDKIIFTTSTNGTVKDDLLNLTRVEVRIYK